MKTVKVDNNHYPIVDSCDVLWNGWESDTKAWLVSDHANYKLVTTFHGQPYFEKLKFLKDKIKEYEKALKDSKKLLALLME